MAKKKLTADEQKAREMEVWESKVNPTGEGEDPVIKGLQGFSGMSNKDALEVALALQQLIRGQNSLLENQDKFGDQINRLRERMDEMDKQAMRWETDRQRFVEEVTRRADQLRLTEEGQGRVRAQAAIDLADETRKARASIAVDRQQYDRWLELQPKETVVSPGKVITITEGGQQQARLIPEEVRIKHRIWKFPPGVAVVVPQPIAETLRSRRRSEEETQARQAVMMKNLESSKLEAAMKEIDTRYNTNGSLGASEAATMI